MLQIYNIINLWCRYSKEINFMKKSIIKEIYLNNEGLGEQVVLNKKYKKASDKAYKFYEQLMDELNDEQKKIFEDFTDSEMDASAEREFLHFKAGLKVGLLLAVECLI